MVSLGTQPANRKSGFGHSSPTGARAQDLSRQPACPDLWGAGVSNDPGLPDPRSGAWRPVRGRSRGSGCGRRCAGNRGGSGSARRPPGRRCARRCASGGRGCRRGGRRAGCRGRGVPAVAPGTRQWAARWALVRGCGQAYALQPVEPVTSRCGTRRVCQARSSGSERDTRARPHAVAPMNCVPEDSRRRSTCTGRTHSPRALADGNQTPSSTVAVRAPSPS